MKRVHVWICFFLVAASVWLEAKTEVYFSPYDNIAQRLIERIDAEDNEVLLAVYCLTHRGIADALVRAKKRGVHVDVIVDPFSLKSRFAVAKLRGAHVTVSVWDPGLVLPVINGKIAQRRRRRPLMHNKFCLFGGKVVWTGSYNFTYDATQFHRENVVVLDDPELTQTYVSQFQEIKQSACRPYDDYVARNPKKTNSILETLKRK